MKLIATTVSIIATPGGIQSHGRFAKSIILFAADSIYPQEGVGGMTPSPKKLKADSDNMRQLLPMLQKL